MPIYNKLVRDNIPEIIAKNGQQARFRVLAEDEFIQKLEEKLQEEVAEYLQDKNADELADILEVVYALGRQLGHTPEALEELRERKVVARGGFDKRLLLQSVIDNPAAKNVIQ
jgi:predicted house-cleaning noncanonical NTP pyrophosphatase (MazG superfamily)